MGLAAMNKSPEVLADRAQDPGEKLGYPAAVDRAFWIKLGAGVHRLYLP
jgi:hypothetical protein